MCCTDLIPSIMSWSTQSSIIADQLSVLSRHLMPQPKPLVPAIDPPPICFRVQVIPPNKNIRHKIYIFDSTTKVFKLKSFLSYPSSKNARNTVFLERHSGKFYTKLLKCVSSKQAVFVYSTAADSAYTLIGLVETDKPSKSGSVAAPSLIFTLCWGDGQNLYAVPSNNSIFKTLTALRGCSHSRRFWI